MASLLIQKFLKPDIRAELVSTRDKYLLEENTWNDTLWGFCNGRGRNLLGHMLMVIRDNADLLILGKKI